MVAPGDFRWPDLRDGRSAVHRLEGEFAVSVGAAVPFDPDVPADWPHGAMPRGLALATLALDRLPRDPQRHYGLVLGLPGLYAESVYLEHVLDHRDSPAAMAAVNGFAHANPLNYLARHAGAAGPRLRVDSACATGSDALIAAWQWIEAGLVDDVLVVAASAMLNPVGVALFHHLQALNDSDDLNASRPFDVARRGFVMGEGAAAVWLSKQPPSPPRGWLAGYGQSMNAEHFVDLPEDLTAMTRACRQALGEVTEPAYINAHGTATRANDRVEARLYRQLFGAAIDGIPVSATKSMIGHTLGASALIEAIVCLEALNEQVAPPTINLTDPDPDCRLNHVTRARPINGNVALTNSFAFGGHNSSLLLARERP
jgi:3-oxoacyl-(acyl-carrier-protein) synthase